MHKNTNNPTFQTLLILCLSLALLLAQTSRMHIHLEHDEHAEPTAHAALILHDYDSLHHDGFQHHNHHPVAIDVSPDNLIQKVNLLNSLILIFLFSGFLLVLPRLAYRLRQRLYLKRFSSRYYLFQPPLRAPPLS